MSHACRLIRSHPRLMVAILAGLVASFTLPSSISGVARLLAEWNVAVWLYLCLMGSIMMTSTTGTVRRIAEREDNSGVVVLVMLSIAATLSLAAIVLELSSAKGLPEKDKLSHYMFTGMTVIGSWLLLGTIYTFHYARLFYRSPATQRALRFPEGDVNPTYVDFLYFSLTIAVAAQTSDVTVMSSPMRRVVLAHSVLSFIFNAAIIGLTINIAAGLVGS